MMVDLRHDAKQLSEHSVWNMKTYIFCRALNDADSIIESTLDVFTDMHHHIDEQKGRKQMHQDIEKLAVKIAEYGNEVENWQKLYKCSV